MPTGSRILKKPTKISIGDMDTKVTLYERNQSAPLNTKYRLNLAKIDDVWTMWEVTAGTQIFDGTNLLGTASDIFTMYYIDKVAKKNSCGTLFIEYDNELYEVIQVKPLDKKNKIFMQLFTNQKGKNEKTGVNIL